LREGICYVKAKGGGHKGLMEGFCYVKAKGGGHSGLLMVKLDMVVQLEIGKIFPQNYFHAHSFIRL
jgi:hypothetical protein